MGNDIVDVAARLPAPWFVGAVALLVCVSTAGVPMPITAALVLAGALALHMPDGGGVLGALLVACTVSMAGRDVIVLVASRHGARWITGWRRRRHRSPDPPSVATQAAARARDSLAAARALLEQHGWWVLFLSRFTVIASPLDIAAGSLGYTPGRFLRAVFPGRLGYVALLLGVGALSGQALQRGADLPTMIGILSAIAIILIIVPTWLSQRALAHARRRLAAAPERTTLPAP